MSCCFGLLERLCIPLTSRSRSPRLVSPTPLFILTTTGNDNVFALALSKHLENISAEELRTFQDAYQTIEPRGLLANLATIGGDDKQSDGRKLADSTEKFLGLLDQLLGSATTGIKVTPEISFLVIGGARLVLDLGKKYVELYMKLTVMIDRLNNHLEFLREFSKHEDLELAQTCTANVYGAILEFYHYAHLVFKSSHDHLRRIEPMQWETFEAQFEEIDTAIRDHLKYLNRSSKAALFDTVTDIKRDRKLKPASKLVSLRAEKRQKILDWICPSDFNTVQEDTLEKRWPGTGTWLLESEDFQAWFSSQSTSLLWCNGPPGAGKSVLSSIVVDKVRKRRTESSTDTASVGLAFAYFRYDKVDSQRPENVIAALTRKLASQLEKLPEDVVGLYETCYQNAQIPSLEQYSESFFSIAGQFLETFVVIDALDECNDKSRYFIFAFMEEVTQRLPTAKIFLTSRPEDSIRETLNTFQVPTTAIKAAGSKTDIATYAREKLDLLTRAPQYGEGARTQRLEIQGAATKDKILDALLKRNDGTFLWVELQLESLCRQKSDKEILKALKTLPIGLNETYARLLQQVAAQPTPLRDLAWRCLVWVLYARKQLRLDEFRDAVLTQDGCVSREQFQNTKEKYPLSALVDICGGLLVAEYKHEQCPNRYRKGERIGCSECNFMRPVHYSFVEFFHKEAAARGMRTVPQVLKSRGKAEAALASTCLRYLRLVCLEAGDAQSYDADFTRYCAQHFDEHFICADAEGMLETALVQLLSLHDDALTALARLKHAGLERKKHDSMYLNWQFNARTIVFTTRLVESTMVRESKMWSHQEVHPFALHLACTNRSIYQIEQMLRVNLSQSLEDVQGRTPMSISLFKEDDKALSLLLQFGADPNEHIQGETVLEAASRRNWISLVQELLDSGARGIEGDSTFSNALFHAVSFSHKDVVDVLLSRGAVFANHHLLMAVEQDQYELLRCFLALGASPDGVPHHKSEAGFPDENNIRPLYCAALNGNERAAKLLLEHGARPNLEGGSIGTAFQAAAFCGNGSIVELLLQYNADLNLSNGWYGSALAAAACAGNRSMASYLLDAGGDVNVVGDKGFRSALEASAVKEIDSSAPGAPNEQNATDILLNAGADVAVQGPAALACAALNGNIKVVELLLTWDCKPDDSDMPVLLHAAVQADSGDLVRRLVGQGADPNERSPSGETALVVAVRRGSEETVETLVRAGADVNLTSCTKDGEIHPLHEACTAGYPGVVRLLLDNGASVYDKGSVPMYRVYGPHGSLTHRKTAKSFALQAACLAGTENESTKIEILRMLLDHGADINAADESGCTALEAACSAEQAHRSSKAAVQLLLSAGADINAPGGYYSSPLEAASASGDSDVVTLLLEAGVADAAAKDSALQAAAILDRAEVLAILLRHGADAQAASGRSRLTRVDDTPLHSAGFEGNAESVRVLLAAGADVGAKGHFGTVHEAALVGLAGAPLHLSGGWRAVVALLRAAGAEEPRADCHYGVRCHGPLCEEYFECDEEFRPRWVTGTRYKCTVCKELDLCAACNASDSKVQVRNTDMASPAEGWQSHKPDHAMIKFDEGGAQSLDVPSQIPASRIRY